MDPTALIVGALVPLILGIPAFLAYRRSTRQDRATAAKLKVTDTAEATRAETEAKDSAAIRLDKLAERLTGEIERVEARLKECEDDRSEQAKEITVLREKLARIEGKQGMMEAVLSGGAASSFMKAAGIEPPEQEAKK